MHVVLGDEYEVYYDKYLPDTQLRFEMIARLADTTIMNSSYGLVVETALGSLALSKNLILSTALPEPSPNMVRRL